MIATKQLLTKELKIFLNNNSVEDLAQKIVNRFNIDEIEDFIMDLPKEEV